jgi:hypothetical protein
LHEEVGNYLRELADQPSRIRELMAQSEDESGQDLAAEHSALLKQQDELLRSRERWQRAYGAGVISLGDFAARLEETGEEEAALEKRME